MATRYAVKYCRKTGDRRIIRVGTHHRPAGITDKDFRLALLKEYLRTNKRVLKIERA